MLLFTMVRSKCSRCSETRRQEALDAFWRSWTPEQRAKIEAVAMDMWEPYVRSTLAHVPQAAEKIVFGKFHVAQHLNQAVDEVRRREHRARLAG